MPCNDNNITNICVDPITAYCVDYDGILSANTTITSTCVTQHQVNEDLYTLIDNLNVGGSTDYVSNVQLSGTSLQFTGVGSAFNSSVDLSGITGSQNLQQVTDIGATTTNSITAPNFILSSDQRLKANVKNISSKKLDVKWKEYILKTEPGDKRYGVIAQELEQNHPEFVKTDLKGVKSVKYIDLLVAKMAEMEEEMKEMKIKLEKAGL